VLVGSLLLTSWSQVLTTAAVYLVIGVVQVLLARRFIALSWDRGGTAAAVAHAAWWDFAFYLLFGIAIAVAVQVAGVLLVFSFLIVPAVISRLFAEGLWSRLCIGWSVAVLASAVGIAASWLWDLPTGATVVVAFGSALVLAGVVRALRGR